MRIVGSFVIFALATLLLSSAALAQPPPFQFTFGGSGSGGGYTASVTGTGTIDPAARMVTIQGEVTVMAPDGSTIVQQEFGHTASWNGQPTSSLTIELQPVEGLSISVTVTPGVPAVVVVEGP